MTTYIPLDDKGTMFLAEMRGTGPGCRRLAAAVLLLAVFSLPLHFHVFTATSQVSKECSCYQGGRTQAGLAPAPADWTPTFLASLIADCQPQLFGWLAIESHAIRAPPSTHAL